VQANDTDAASSGPRAWIAWAALGVALSPVIVDALRLAIDQWWARGSLLMAALAVSCMVGPSGIGARGRRRPGVGAALVAFALAAALLAAGGGMIRLARPAIPIAVIGMGLFLGRPSPRRAALLCFAVAPPRALLDALPGLHDWIGPRPLVDAPDGGLPLLWLLAGLGAYAGVRRGDGVSGIAARALRYALLALPLQAVALLVASRLWRGGHADAARLLLSHGVWILSAAALLLHVHRRERDVSGLERQ
jgi:hypothetical protein